MLRIEDSKYAMRMWPASLARSEHCLDFIEAKTGKLVNAPDEYAIWCMPDPAAPWLQGCGPIELVSLERSFGMQPADIPEGAEKFVLRDGMTCMLTRPDGPPAMFAVPLRHQPPPYRNFQVLTPVRAN